jgi:hypothetical protein
MSSRKENILICDFCNKEKTDRGETFCGGHPFSGWFHVTIHGGSTRLEDLQKKRDFDFCSSYCVTTYFKENGQ